jgi:hypothetical protein
LIEVLLIIKERGMNCSTNNNGFQLFPKKGQLHKNLNLDLETLREIIGIDDATVYRYVIATIKNQEGTFIQEGSGPNFQGDYITLCTCKHKMRCYKDIKPGTWIAGFSNVKAGNGKQALVYLMKIQHTFESHQNLWFDKRIPARTKLAKAAHRHKCGDLYMPKSRNIGGFKTKNYEPPREGHSHKENWHYDIRYPDYLGRTAKLVIGNQKLSFLWNRPMLFSPEIQCQGEKKYSINDFTKSKYLNK